MANCFMLLDKVTGKPVKLNDVDQAMCEHFGVPVHPTKYYDMWFDLEGFALAMGKTWDEMRTMFEDRDAIIDFLSANYTPDAWAQR
jgi:hypothetical protein